jgi:AcrR family transcriptional regulator
MAKQNASGRPESRIGQRRRAALANTDNAEYKSKRAELLNIAAAVFKDRGYEAAALNDVAERFGTDRASLYYYVSGKEELFQGIIEGVLETNLAEAERLLKLDDTARHKLELFIKRLVESYVETYPSSYVYIAEDMAKVAELDSPWARRMVRQTRRLETIALNIIQQGVDDGEFRDDIPTPLVANTLFGMLNWTHRWFRPGGKWAPEQLSETFAKVLFEGVDRPR